MKKGFSLIEIIFVIVIIGILSSVLTPTFKHSNLTTAAHQIISHIRYTQHLAMIDNQFSNRDGQWFQARWQIRFFKNLSFTSPDEDYKDFWSYAIYSENPNYTHNPDISEIAKNPLNNKQLLSGGFNNILYVEDERVMKEMQLNKKYNIKDIKFTGGCRGGINHLEFDYIGRPLNNYIKKDNNNTYGTYHASYPRLIERRCEIQLCNVDDCDNAMMDEKITIAIEAETGYAHIL